MKVHATATLLIIMLAACGQVDAPPTSRAITKDLPPTAIPVQTTPSVVPAAAPAGQAVQQEKPGSDAVPPCKFIRQASAELNIPPLEAYHFDSPKPLMESYGLGLAGWLPDNRRVLMTRQLGGPYSQAVIETLDTETGALERYADTEVWGKPIWIAEEQAIIYGTYGDNDKRGVVRIAHGKGAAPEEMLSDVGGDYLRFHLMENE